MGKLRKLNDLASFLYVQRVKGFEIADEPWLDEETTGWFRDRLASAHRYLEFGSGGSTRLAARLQLPTISVECDRFFASAVRKGLAGGHKVTLIDAPIGFTGAWGVPMPGKPTPERVAAWRSYITMPFEELDRQGGSFPDFVMVDGRFRRACALQTALKAQQLGGSPDILFDDYYSPGREHYAQVEHLLGAPQRIGRSALFHITPDLQVKQADVDAALRDYR